MTHWQPLFSDLPREHGFEPLRIDGALPPDLRGTLYRCGPATTGRAGHRYRHWFDGDGAVTAVKLGPTGAAGAVRFVDTPGRIAEARAGRALYPTFATLPPGSPRPLPRPKPAANTSVLALDDRLFALYEAGSPVELDRELTTRGVCDFGIASLREGFAAHPHAVPARRAVYGFGLHNGEPTRLALYELRAGAVRELGAITLDGPTMVHDFAATERHLVFFVAPLRVDVAPFLRGQLSYSDSLRWRPELGTEVLVVPIDDPGTHVRFTTDPFFHWHVANAREQADAIVVDFVRYEDFASNRWMTEVVAGQMTVCPRGTLTRASIDLRAWTLHAEPRADLALEFPVCDPTRPEHVYAVAHAPGPRAGPYDRLCRVDLATGATTSIDLGAGQFPSEPVLAPPWLLALVFDAPSATSYVAVLDTRRLEAGPVARVWFDHHIPFTLHGLWQAS